MFPSGAFRKAALDTLSGVFRKMAVFLVVALCFYALVILREWHTSYAPSVPWADAVEEERLEWSPIVSAAARDMARAKPKETYSSSASFYEDLSGYLKDEGRQLSLKSPAALTRFQRYQEDVEARKDCRTALHMFWRKSVELIKTNEAIAAGNREIKKLKQKPPVDEKKVGDKEDELKDLKEQRDAILGYMKDLGPERAGAEVGLQRLLTDLDARIKASEDGIKEAFDASASSARPVGRIREGLPQKYAIQVGDEDDPLHIFYVIAWYGLEAVIVLLLCFIFVPWLIRFGGGASAPETVQSTFSGKIKALLGSAFGQDLRKGVGKTLALAAVGSLAAAGVTMAAGSQPPIGPVILHEDGAAGAEGKKGDKGEQGDAGKDGSAGSPGENGSAVNGSKGDRGDKGDKGDKGEKGEGFDLLNLMALIDYQERRLAEQDLIIDRLEQEIEQINDKVGKNMEALGVLARNTDKAIAESMRLSSGLGDIEKGVSQLNGTVGYWIDTNQSLLRLSNTANSYLLGSMIRLEGTTAATTENVRQVQKTFDQAASNVPSVTTDVLRINAIPDGAWTRVSPFRRYRVTDEVKETVKRAMKAVDDEPKNKIVGALAQVQAQAKAEGKDKDGMWVWGFREKLYAECPSEAHDLLEQWMPLIMKVSRIPEHKPWPTKTPSNPK